MDGYIGVLPGHAPLLSELKPGGVLSYNANGQEKVLAVYGGFVEVQSELGKGTQFEVWLPAIEKKITQPGEDKPLEMPSGRGELILVVDDEEAIQQIARATLENYGYRVLSAINRVGSR